MFLSSGETFGELIVRGERITGPQQDYIKGYEEDGTGLHCFKKTLRRRDNYTCVI
jgi:hypothetical protein